MMTKKTNEKKINYDRTLNCKFYSFTSVKVHSPNWIEKANLSGNYNFSVVNWFEDNEKELYSVKDIVSYIYSLYPGLKESLNEDSKLSLEKQIRRVMKKKFDLLRNDKNYRYVLGETEVIYLVDVLMRDYLEHLIFPGINAENAVEALITFYKFAYGDNWYSNLMKDFEDAQKSK